MPYTWICWRAAMDKRSWILADWPAPAHVGAGCTTRLGGVSRVPYASLNLALHVQDDPQAVQSNRQRLHEFLRLPAEPRWLTQVHGCAVSQDNAGLEEADASLSRQSGNVCVVLTADCLPVLLCDRAGSVVAAVHAGWRGLAAGVISKTVSLLGVPANEVLVWLGPAIGPQAFEVGPEVRAAFVTRASDYATAFVAGATDRWHMDIYAAARIELGLLGVEAVYGGGLCTYADHQRFYSYRRDGQTGRMASLIWLAG